MSNTLAISPFHLLLEGRQDRPVCCPPCSLHWPQIHLHSWAECALMSRKWRSRVITINWAYLQTMFFCTPKIFCILKPFNQISGLTVNPAKSRALNITRAPETLTHFTKTFPFNWSTYFIKYLGVNLTPHYDSLYGANYITHVTQIDGPPHVLVHAAYLLVGKNSRCQNDRPLENPLTI